MLLNRRGLLGSAGTLLPSRAAIPWLAGGMLAGSVEEAFAADQKLSALTLGTQSDYIYGIQSGNSRKFTGLPYLNVKDFGATGDGTTDDTVAIQNCLDAAFGSFTSPHGGQGASPGPKANRGVVFPAGEYMVSAATTAVTGSASGTGGNVRLTVGSTSGMASGEPVTITGVNGTTEANGIQFVTVDDATHVTLIGTTFVNAFASSPSGLMTRSCLRVRSVQGGHIRGESRFSTRIHSTTTNANVFGTNAFGFSQVEGIQFTAVNGGAGAAFLLSWQHSDTGATVSTQSNSFYSCTFEGGTYGLALGISGEMSSETSIYNCSFGGTTYGIYCGNGNSIQTGVYGGNIQSCDYGIYVYSGSCNVIHGVGFQQNRVANISVQWNAGDAYSIQGCRDENDVAALTFLILRGGACAHVGGTSFQASFPGNIFCDVEYSGSVILDGCSAYSGKFVSNGNIFARGCRFGNLDAFAAYTGGNATIEDCLFGNWLDTSIAKYVTSQRIALGNVRTYKIEGAALTDGSFLYASLPTIAGTGSKTFTVTSANPGVFSVNGGVAHFFTENTAVSFTTTGALPTALTALKTYYVKVVNSTTFNVAATPGGAAINCTAGTQSGVHSIYFPRLYAVGDQVLKTNVTATGSPGWVCTTAGYSLPESGGGNAAVMTPMPPLNAT